MNVDEESKKYVPSHVLKIFEEMAEQVRLMEKVKVAGYEVDKLLYDDWKDFVDMDLHYYIELHPPKDADTLEHEMEQIIYSSLVAKGYVHTGENHTD